MTGGTAPCTSLLHVVHNNPDRAAMLGLFPSCMLCRRLYAEDGRFDVGNVQDWQHSAMYMAFLLSGAIDLVAHMRPGGVLPEGIEHVSKE